MYDKLAALLSCGKTPPDPSADSLHNFEPKPVFIDLRISCVARIPFCDTVPSIETLRLFASVVCLCFANSFAIIA